MAGYNPLSLLLGMNQTTAPQIGPAEMYPNIGLGPISGPPKPAHPLLQLLPYLIAGGVGAAAGKGRGAMAALGGLGRGQIEQQERERQERQWQEARNQRLAEMLAREEETLRGRRHEKEMAATARGQAAEAAKARAEQEERMTTLRSELDYLTALRKAEPTHFVTEQGVVPFEEYDATKHGRKLWEGAVNQTFGQEMFKQWVAQQTPKPGVTVPLPEAVVAQKKEIAAAGRPTIGGLSTQQSSATQALAARFDAHPVVKAFNETALRYEGAKRIVNSGTGGVGDVALVYEFMRALDPTSVVRESEFAAAAKSGNLFLGAMARFNGYFKETGGMLPDQVKQAFLKVLDQKMNVAKSQVKAVYEDFARRIDKITGQAGTGKDYLTDYTEMIKEETEVPQVGGTFQGKKITKVTRVK